MATERDYRTHLMNGISDLLGIPRDQKGVGSSVYNSWLNPVCRAVGIDPDDSAHSNKYRRLQALLEWFGEEYDPKRDTSEATASAGGGTITNVGLEKLYSAMTRDRSRLRIATVSEIVADEDGPLDFDLPDSRRRVLAEIAVRRGQAAFRRELLDVYGGRCAVTGCDAEPVLEAAHITPYRGDHTNTVTNGLLLRADIHTLFDLGGLGINPDDGWRVVLGRRVRTTAYAELEGAVAFVPRGEWRPSIELLRRHLALFALA